MTQEIVLMIVAILLSGLGVGAIKRWSGNARLMDVPNERSSHARPTPRGGGLAIVLITLLGLLLWQTINHSWAWPVIAAYIAGAALIAAVSWVDDLRTLPVRVRFLAHIAAALIATLGIGYWQFIAAPGLEVRSIGWLGLPLTFIWIVGLTNAYNFMDGIDGIAGSTAVIAGVGWAALGIVHNYSIATVLGGLIAAASLGFLFHNWHPARIFMGDVGSAFLGYSFAVLPLLVNPANPALPLAAVLFVWPFVFDAGYTLLRRLVRREDVFAAHRTHLYQRLVIAGLSHSWVTSLYFGLGVTGALLALYWTNKETSLWSVLVLPLLCLGLLMFVLLRENEIISARLQQKNGLVLGANSMRRRIYSFPQKLRNRHFLFLDALIFLVTPFIALELRADDGDFLQRYASSLVVTTIVFLIIKLVVLYYGDIYRRLWHYAGVEDLARSVVLCFIALILQTAVFFLALHPLGWIAPSFPSSIPVIDGILTVLAVVATRSSVRWSTWLQLRYHILEGGTRVIIAGAGDAGVLIVEELKRNPQLGMIPAAFVDDDPGKKGMRIRGIPVLGACKDLAHIADSNHIENVIIAMPKASGRAIREIVAACQQANVHVKTVPGVYEVLGRELSAREVRDIRIEDLLRREPIRTDTSAVGKLVTGRRVLVTGGGGSIGSELCRQLLTFSPSKLIVLGHGENSVFEIANELEELIQTSRQRAPLNGVAKIHTTIQRVIADIRDISLISSVLEEQQPEIIFHAAAHKHVPLMEANPREAITNNVLGTRNLINAAQAAGVKHFVMISTDKSVNPTSIMGASKRLAELIVYQAAAKSKNSYVAVRFGNVLGSRGSVVHTFRRQIERGGPVTVTSPDMVRYFMSIPEAVQLVLQAATLGAGGEIFTLDMGDPVRIVDLATDMIRLAGYEPGHDIDIVFSGARPGEKMYEELFLSGEDYQKTQADKIFIAANAASYVPTNLNDMIAKLEQAAYRNDREAILDLLQQLIPEFQHSSSLNKQNQNTDAATPTTARSTVAVEPRIEKALASGMHIEPGV